MDQQAEPEIPADTPWECLPAFPGPFPWGAKLRNRLWPFPWAAQEVFSALLLDGFVLFVPRELGRVDNPAPVAPLARWSCADAVPSQPEAAHKSHKLLMAVKSLLSDLSPSH